MCGLQMLLIVVFIAFGREITEWREQYRFCHYYCVACGHEQVSWASGFPHLKVMECSSKTKRFQDNKKLPLKIVGGQGET